jgi:hypothetical protein
MKRWLRNADSPDAPIYAYPSHMNDAAKLVFATCLGGIMRDEPWQDFGFVKRPRYGRLFKKLKPPWRTSLENRVLQMMLASFTTAHVLARRINYEEVQGVIVAYATDDDVVAALGYASRQECGRHLIEAIWKFAETPVADWHALILKRVDPLSIPDKELSTLILMGCARYAENMNRMISGLKET